MNYPIEIGIPTIFDSLFLFPIFSTIELSFRFRVERSTETFRDEISRFVTFVTLVALSVTTPFDPFFPNFYISFSRHGKPACTYACGATYAGDV